MKAQKQEATAGNLIAGKETSMLFYQKKNSQQFNCHGRGQQPYMTSQARLKSVVNTINIQHGGKAHPLKDLLW